MNIQPTEVVCSKTEDGFQLNSMRYSEGVHVKDILKAFINPFGLPTSLGVEPLEKTGCKTS